MKWDSFKFGFWQAFSLPGKAIISSINWLRDTWAQIAVPIDQDELERDIAAHTRLYQLNRQADLLRMKILAAKKAKKKSKPLEEELSKTMLEIIRAGG